MFFYAEYFLILLYAENSRPKDILIELGDGTLIQHTLDDGMGWQSIPLLEPFSTSYVKITILSVYRGSKYTDTCISEISLTTR